jgi:hypothetical protein
MGNRRGLEEKLEAVVRMSLVESGRVEERERSQALQLRAKKFHTCGRNPPSFHKWIPGFRDMKRVLFAFGNLLAQKTLRNVAFNSANKLSHHEFPDSSLLNPKEYDDVLS